MTTGAVSSRPIRQSDLVFGWRASGFGKDSPSGLDAYTGQVASYTASPSISPGMIEGRNGSLLVPGRGMPRFEQALSRGGVTRLVLEGEVIDRDVENVSYPWPLLVMSLSVYVRLWPLYAAGASVSFDSWAWILGNATTDGGLLGLCRVGTNWQARRIRGGTEIAAAFVEPAAIVFPVDLLVTLSSGGQISLYSRDAASPPVLRNGTLQPTDANMMIPTEPWAGNVFSLAGAGSRLGGRWRYENLKIARGVHTFASIDALS
jgi:hypothetical protein